MERSGKRKTAVWAIVLGLLITVFGYLSEGGDRIVDTRRGRSTATSIKLQIIATGLAFTGYGVVSLFRLRDDA